MPNLLDERQRKPLLRFYYVGQFANVWADYEIREIEGEPAISLGVTNIQVYYDGIRWWILGWQNIKRKSVK